MLVEVEKAEAEKVVEVQEEVMAEEVMVVERWWRWWGWRWRWWWW